MDEVDVQCMKEAIAAARQSPISNEREPKVGAVARLANGEIVCAFRSEEEAGDHAEFTLLHKKLGSAARIEGATVYTTLEPCTVGSRGHGKQPCAEWIVRNGVRRVFIGLLDPNPTICGRGYWRLLESGIITEFFPYELATQVKTINAPFVALYRSRRPVDTAYEFWIQQHKSPEIMPFPGFGLGVALEIQASPSLQEGWHSDQVVLSLDDDNAFTIPPEHAAAFKEYSASNYERKRFFDDGEKFMAERNPVSFEEAPTLNIRLRKTTYSIQHFYRDVIAKIPSRKASLTKEFVVGSLSAGFAHSCSLQMVVVTRDNKILLTERSKKTGLFDGLWSCSVEEDLRRQDLTADGRGAFLAWGKRLLREELQLEASDYYDLDIRLLSVFLESDFMNVSFCAYCPILSTSDELDAILKVRRGDIEFTRWDFLELNRRSLLQELLRPSRLYHPSSPYRLLMTFIKNFGYPTQVELST